MNNFVPVVLLHAVQGVTTIWIWDETGALIFGCVEGEMVLDGPGTLESWQQIESLLTSHPETQPGRQEVTLDFDTYLLHARREKRLVAAVLAEPHVNLNAVRLGLNTFFRRWEDRAGALPQRALGNQ